MGKNAKRECTILLRLTAAEKALFESVAAKKGLRPGTWGRIMLLERAKQERRHLS